jgi:peptide/nickel transport system substrate-binding protein
MHLLTGVTGPSVSVLAAGLLVVAACGLATQPTPPTGAPAPGPAPTPQLTLTAPTIATQPTVPAPTIMPTPGAGALGNAPARPGGRVILGDIADAKTLNPVLAFDLPSLVVLERIYASLLDDDPTTGDVTPALAETYGFSADGKTLTFVLRDGLKFSDGSPLTGDDFKFTIMATLRSRKTNHKDYYEPIVGAKDYIDGTADDLAGVKVDGNTITVTLSNSFCPALELIGTTRIIPRSVFSKYLDPGDASKNLDDAPENNAPPVASGPFVFKEWVPNDHVTLVRNDTYWRKANIDEWVHKVYSNQDALTAALKVGEVDMAQFDPKDAQAMQSGSSINVFRYLGPGYTYIGWNQLRGGKEFLQDKVVRQALAYGLNVDFVIQRVLFGEGVRMVAHTPPVSWAYDASGLNDYKYDPAKAEQLLQGDGWTKGSDGIYAKDGQKLEFSIVTNSGNVIREAVIQVAAEEYRQIGINAQPKTESLEALVDRIDTSRDPKYGEQGGRDFDAVLIGWALPPDPDMYSIWDSAASQENNSILYKNADLDKAIEDGRTKCAMADRKAAYKTANQILNEEQPYNFGYATNILLGVNKKIQNIKPGTFAFQGQASPETWWVQ